MDDLCLLIQDLILSTVNEDAKRAVNRITDLKTLGAQRHGYRVPLEQHHGRDRLELSFLDDLIVFEAKRILFES